MPRGVELIGRERRRARSRRAGSREAIHDVARAGVVIEIDARLKPAAVERAKRKALPGSTGLSSQFLLQRLFDDMGHGSIALGRVAPYFLQQIIVEPHRGSHITESIAKASICQNPG